MASITTLIDDLHALLAGGVEVGDLEWDELGGFFAAAAQLRMFDKPRQGGLRLSKVGAPDRQLWYEANTPHIPREKDEPIWRLRSTFGNLTEELLLWLVSKAGHTVTDQQKEVFLDGVPGHIDCLIDGVLVDIKSMSPFGFRKFKAGGLFKPGGDPFGYVAQLSCYNEALGLQDESAYWLAMDKSSGELYLRELTSIEQIDGMARIKEAREVIAQTGEGPPRCYPLVNEGKSGNKALSFNCTWCQHKHDCYSKANDGKGIRTFQYAGGRQLELAVVKKTPRVPEVT